MLYVSSMLLGLFVNSNISANQLAHLCRLLLDFRINKAVRASRFHIDSSFGYPMVVVSSQRRQVARVFAISSSRP